MVSSCVQSSLIKLTSNLSLQELVDWYVATYEAINSNKYLTMRVAQDANDAFANQMKSTAEQSIDKMFYLQVNGTINPRILCILGSLFYAKDLLVRDVGNEIVDITEMDNMEGTEWEKVTNAMAKGFMRSSSPYCELNTKMDEKFSSSVFSALRAIKVRIHGLMSTSTTEEEDKTFLAAAVWDGFGGLGVSESGCLSCRWQIEELSFNDYLAVSYRLYSKYVLKRSLSQLSCVDAENNITISNGVNQSVDDDRTYQASVSHADIMHHSVKDTMLRFVSGSVMIVPHMYGLSSSVFPCSQSMFAVLCLNYCTCHILLYCSVYSASFFR